MEKKPKYRVRLDHVVEGKSRWSFERKEDAMKLIRNRLQRFPYVIASLRVLNKKESAYKDHSSYEFRKNRKTKRWRLVKL